MSGITLGTEGLASQSLATLALGPSFIGWSVQLLVTGATWQAASPHFLPAKHSHLSNRLRYLLNVIVILNTIVCGLTFFEVFYWGTRQFRTPDALWQYTVPDAIVPIPSGLLTALVQAYFGQRAWRVAKKNIGLASIIALGILMALASALASVYYALQPSTDDASFDKVFIVNQLWMWSSAVTDLTISGVLTYGLASFKATLLPSTTRSETEHLMSKTMRLAMQTAGMTTLFAVSAAIVQCATYQSDSLSVYFAFLYPLPSIYTYSFLWCANHLHARAIRNSMVQGRSSELARQHHFDHHHHHHHHHQETSGGGAQSAQQQQHRPPQDRDASAALTSSYYRRSTERVVGQHVISLPYDGLESTSGQPDRDRDRGCTCDCSIGGRQEDDSTGKIEEG